MSLFHPRVRRYLVENQGEEIIDEVRKQWAALVLPVLEMIGGGILLLAALMAKPPIAQVLGLVGLAIVLHGLWRLLAQTRDIFVITNMRVFRVHGILSQQIATMPLTRILDISVYKPLIGRILGYGNFVFESAAQAQGLREIKFVGDPDRRDRTIQSIITQAGLRGFSSGTSGAPTSSAPISPAETAEDIVEAHRGDDWSTDIDGEDAWETAARLREDERLLRLRVGVPPPPPLPRDPDSTDTAPIDLPR